MLDGTPASMRPFRILVNAAPLKHARPSTAGHATLRTQNHMLEPSHPDDPELGRYGSITWAVTRPTPARASSAMRSGGGRTWKGTKAPAGGLW